MLTKQDEIRSTEKLLEVIRSPKPVQKAPENSDQPSPALDTRKTPIIKTIPFQKKIRIGVDIGHTYVRLAKIQRLSDRTFELRDYLDVPLSSATTLNDPNFLNLLRSHLEQFCANESSFEIWSAIASAEVDIRCIRIPKLPRRQIHNAVFWTFTKKVDFDSTREIFDYEIIGDVIEGGVKKIEVIAFKAPKQDISALKNAFEAIGYPLKGISIVPFAIQNLFRSQIVYPPEDSICCLFIGRDWSRIAIYSKGNLVLSRGIKAGMYSMIEAVNMAVLNSKKPDHPESSVSQKESEHNGRSSTIHPRIQKLFFEFIHATKHPVGESRELEGYPLSYLFQMILPAIQRLVRQVERTFEHFALNFNREGVRRIYISGQVTASDMIVDYIGKQLDLPIIVMDPFGEGKNFSENVHIPQDAAERESYVPAIGLALSSNQKTPNFLYTHQDRDRFEHIRRVNMRVLTICMLTLIMLIGVFTWQERRLDDKRAQIDKLNHKLLQYSPPAEKDILLALYGQTKQKRQTLNRIVQRYAPAAVMNELAQITPSNVRLLRIDAAFSSSTKNPEKKTSDGEQNVVIEGIIFDDRQNFEAALTGYLLTLKNSPIFQKPNVQTKRVEYYNAQNVLRFSARVELL